LWVQNEDTAHLPDVVDRRSFKQLLDFGGPKAKEPEESRRCFQVREGFAVQLVASEPQVRDPVAFDWGADGKLWVAEMGDYPSGTDGKGKPGGVVRWLEDADGDGRYEKSTVFLEGLNFPNGVLAWGKGVLISAAPDILYAEDTTGDGRADLRRVLFTGFREGNQQHRMNGFALGLDNWIYAANGDSGGTVKSLATGKRTNISGRDFRFKVTGEFETVAGQTQFGRWRDDWGNWFGNNNPNWLWHYHMPLRYLARNPQLAVGATHRNTFSSNRCFPISAKMVRPNNPQSYGHVTSANSATPYRGGLFGKDFARSVFISEPVHNLVHREVLVPDGVSFKSHRAAGEEKSEFLASTDNWFRPTQIKTGPDGALYIADMYRLIIEHPEWIPAAMQSRVDLRAGHDKGRIWRVVPKGAKLRKIPRLDKLPTQQLVWALDHPNGWQRDTAQRLLIARNDPKSHPLLGSIAANMLRGKVLPQTRIHALHTLEGMNALNEKTLARALRDDHAAVREHAVRLCEINGGGNVALARQCLTDKSPRVLRQLAFTLGQGKGKLVTEGLVYLAVQNPKNADLQLAIKSSAAPHAAAMLKQIFSQKARPPADLSNHLLQLATTGKQLDALALVLNDLTPADLTIMAGLLDALHARGQTLIDFQKTAPSKLQAALDKTQVLFKHARATATNPKATVAERRAAILLLARGFEPIGKTDADKKILVQLLAAEHPPALQKTAFATLRKVHQPHLVSALLGSWKTFSPTIRAEAIDTLLSRNEWTQALLATLEKGNLAPNQISPAHRQKLTQHSDATFRVRATKLFGKVDPNRAKVIARYADIAKLKGNAEDGAFLFKANCAVCHRYKNQGNPVGPDLATLAGKPIADWLAGILDPNRAVEDKYVGYVIITRNATVHTGVITAETPTSLTLRTAIGAEQIILRANIKTLQSTGQSLMPPGLEAALPPAAMADLLVYLRGE
jgi:putative membrane-bound dehydrogenase-like protein